MSSKNIPENNNQRKATSDFIVGIGASAGGLEAMQKLLSALPSNTGFPFIVVQHLSPDYKSLLSEILGKYTSMPVVQVEDGMEIQPNCVYVIQPGKNMRISEGKLLLSAQKEHELNLPIDMFFRSLADYAGPRAISIILSGTGSDGSNGIKSIKENDGMIIVQDPESSKFDGMPRSAMRTGLVDAQLTPEDIALELEHISLAAQNIPTPYANEKQVDEELMKKVYYILKKISNVNFTHYKQTTILRRIERRMMLTHKETLEDYVAFLYESPDEVKILSKEVLIGVTNFFRDPEFFQSLKDNAIKNILIHSSPEEAVRVWVAGCSTGEEAYSIAILFTEMLETLKIKRVIKIFATDLDVEAISIAGKGVYGENIVDSVSAVRLSRYFTKTGNTYVVNRDIRQMIVFSPHNVFQDPPFGRLDLVSCRNMLIYFQTVLQNDLFAIFHSALKEGAYLFLGKSEAIGVYTEAYPVVDAAAKLFTHRADVKIAGSKVIPYLQTAIMDEEYINDDDAAYSRRTLPGEISIKDETAIDTELLERFMPACIVVNDKNDIIHTYGESSNYIHFSIGKVSNGLYDVLTEALKVPVSTLLKESREKQKAVQYKDIRLKGEHTEVVVNLTAMPASKKASSGELYYAIVISETVQRGELVEAIPYEIDRVASQRITDLEQDLGEVQEKLKHSVAEQECVNEELQAANEELLTANEELQSSNEELQSVNEELYTVNSEYQSKLSELADMNDDIANFLSSTLIGIIFVDNKLSIRRYTDYVASEFSVMDHDIGRSLKFISYHFPTVDISEICDNVLKTLVPDEREITTGKNKVFFMRVAPYRTTENKILGCVITLVDVTTQKQGLALLRNAEQQLSIVKQANEAKGDFLSRISAEIRTPISAVLSLAQTAQTQVGDNPELENTIEKIGDTIRYMNSLISDISDISTDNNAEEDNKAFNLHDIISDVKDFYEPRAKIAGLEFSVNVDGELPSQYFGSKTRVKQVLMNFLSNSIKFTKPGGAVSLSVKEDAVIGDQSSVCFVVKDTGIGISEEYIPEMFKPFTREGREEIGIAGLGLGLSIANNLIQMMGGDVKVESEIGVGSTFTIHVILNRVENEAINLSDDTLPDSFDLSGLHALVVDDNTLNRTILNSILAHEGISAEEACDGAEAVKKFTTSPVGTFDCILMDIRMPNIDGIEASRMIRESGREDAKSIPIIGVSANGFSDDIEKARQAGINCYTTKPIDSQKLFKAMTDCIK